MPLQKYVNNIKLASISAVILKWKLVLKNLIYNTETQPHRKSNRDRERRDRKVFYLKTPSTYNYIINHSAF